MKSKVQQVSLLVSLWTLICFARASLTPYHMDSTPKIHPLGKDQVARAGESIEMDCSGHKPVEWEVPMDEEGHGKPLSERTSYTTKFIEGDNPRPYVVRLKVVALHYLDTGYFYCKHNGTRNNDDDLANVSRTYLFVRDPDHLIDDARNFYFEGVVQHAETVIPCRPTDPAVSMTFKRESEDISNKLEQYLLKYEPKRGLVITQGTLPYHQGMYSCIARLGDKVASLTVVINFQHAPDVVPTPFIREPKTDPIFVGANISMECQLFIDNRMPHIELKWSLPQSDLKNDLAQKRIIIGEQKMEKIDPKNDLAGRYTDANRIIVKSVSIDPVAMSDKGSYSCKAEMQRANKTSTSHKIHLQNILNKADQAFIGDPEFNGDPEIIIKQQPRTVSWVFSVQANPDPGFTWLHPTGNEVDFSMLKKYEMNIDPDLDMIKLNIRDADLRDTGQYQLNIEVEDSNGKVISKDIDLALLIVRSPHLSFEVTSQLQPDNNMTNSLFIENEVYDINCMIEGYPINTGTLKWQFAHCTSYDDCHSRVEVKPDTLAHADGNTLGSYHYLYKSSTQWVAERSGYLSCHVCSEYEPTIKAQGECNSTTIPIFVTDFATGFDIESSAGDQEVIEGDKFNLTCAASVYEYDSVEWRRKGLSGEDEVIKTKENVQVLEKVTKYSHVSTLSFGNVSLSDSGHYKCVARNSKAQDTSHFQLEVLEVIPPKFNKKVNMNGSEVEIEASSKLRLNCLVTGRPRPDIVWKKDGAIITNETYSNETAMEFQRQGQVLFMRFAKTKFSGLYSCTASNRGGSDEAKLKVDIKAQQVMSKGLIAGVVVGLVVLCILSAVLCWKVKIYNRKYKELTRAELDMFIAGDPQSINPELGVDDQADLLPYNRDFEFSRDKLKLGKQLGSGAFGRVVKAQAFGIVPWERSTIVAVKMVKPHADITYIKALMAELKIMMHLGKHLNIVNLLGSCTKSLGQRELLVIVEYCRFGNIQKYLLLHRSNYINQIDPETGEINFSIGSDVIASHGNNLPRAREEDEMSAAYANRNLSISTTDGLPMGAIGEHKTTAEGYVPLAVAAAGGPMCRAEASLESASCGSQMPTEGNNNMQVRKKPSVRYIADPAMQVRVNRRQRQQSTMSDYNDGLDQVVLTDMTTVQIEDTGGESVGESSCKYKRSVSAIQGPGWRSNVRGDYDTQTVRPISTKDIICWAYQVARGMEYLASKKVMHGDLACRNILLAADNVVKICDFGLAKDIYKTNNYRKKTDGPLPVKWMAIESLRDRVFSTQSDVWSFGIVLWEMFSLGKTPYPGIENGEHYHKLLKGYRMEKPDFCPRLIYRMMSDCWKEDPCQRPDFNELMDTLGDLLEDGERDNYLDLSQQFVNKHGNAVENKDYLSMFSSPDYNSQMTSRCNGDILEEEEGYLVPEKVAESTGQDGYLIPKEKKPEELQLSQVDDSGYWVRKLSTDNDERQPMMLSSDQDTSSSLIPT